MFFTITLTAVAVMLLYSVPGFLLIRSRLVRQEAIPAFATVLMYVCQPCLTVYSFQKAEFSAQLAGELLLFFLTALVLQSVLLGAFYFIFRRKFSDIKYRIGTIATTLGNCTFMGVPLLEALFPEHPETIVFSLAYFLAMSVLSWTAASYIITQNRKYISIRKLFLNPAMLSMLFTIPIWVAGFQLPAQLDSTVTLLGKMTTPLCMLVLGMRLGTVRLLPIFTSGLSYFVIGIKQLAMPLLVFLVTLVLPLDTVTKQTMFILAATPVASVVLNFAEMLGEGQETAANVVLLGTLLSILTCCQPAAVAERFAAPDDQSRAAL